MEETEPNTVGCFCVRTSFRWQWVTEFSVKTQRHLHLTFFKGNVHIMLAGLEVLPHMWKKLYKAFSLRMSRAKSDSLILCFLSPTDLPQVVVELHSGLCSFGETISGSAALICILFFFFFSPWIWHCYWSVMLKSSSTLSYLLSFWIPKKETNVRSETAINLFTFQNGRQSQSTSNTKQTTLLSRMGWNMLYPQVCWVILCHHSRTSGCMRC